MPDRPRQPWSGHLTRRGREAVVFVAAAAVALDGLFLVVDLVNGSPVAGIGGPYLNGWGFAKALLAAAGLLAVAWWVRSLGWAMSAGVFVLVAVQDSLSWHGRAGIRLARALDLSGLTRLVPASANEWGSFLVVLGVAAVGAGAVFFAWLSHRSLRRAALVLGILLAALFVFAAVFDLWGSARPDLPLGWVEELGESFVLSLALGYVAGLAAVGPSRLSSARRRGVTMSTR